MRFLAAAHPYVRLPSSKLSQAPCIPRARVFADSCEELSEMNLVIRYGAFTRAALLLHPLAELCNR